MPERTDGKVSQCYIGIGSEGQTSFLSQYQDLPNHDWGEPELVAGVLQGAGHPRGKTPRLQEVPHKDMRIEQKFQRLSTSRSCSAAGLRVSPTISPVLRNEPSQESGRSGGGGGRICAAGLPRRVTKTGRPVRLTCSRTARQVALNLETGIVSMERTSSSSYYGPRPWSTRAGAGFRADVGIRGA